MSITACHPRRYAGSSSNITSSNLEDWFYGLQRAFVTFLGETYEGVFDGGRLLSFHCSNFTAITSIPCKFRGEITAANDRISADPLHIVTSFSGQSRPPYHPISQCSQANLWHLLLSAEFPSTLVPISNSKTLIRWAFRHI